MGTKTRIILSVLAVVVLATIGVGTMGGFAGAARPAPSPKSSATNDVSGPCDEAEHANDPQCTGGAVGSPSPSGDPSPEGSPSVEPSDDPSPEPGEDISGPCDEAERANDPQCNGQDADNVNEGPGDVNDDQSDTDDDHEDVNDHDDNSGHGSDNSDPGSGEQNDTSGPGN